MELRYENLKNKPKAFRAFTGFDVEEFQILLQAFTVAWERYVQQHRLPPEIRQRSYGGGRKPRLATCQDKLLFILVYLKTYPLQEVLAFHFHMSQGQACQWIHVLSEVLQWTLGELGHLPERDPQKVVNVKLKMDYYGAGNSREIAEKNPYLSDLNPASFPHLQSTLSSSPEVCNYPREY